MAMRPTKTGSDGSVHQAAKVAAVAWIISTREHEYVKACFLMTENDSMNSYRAELEGMYRALYHMHQLGVKPEGDVTQWFDNESGVKMSNRPLKTGTDKMQPEGGILMAIQHLKQKLPYAVTSQHVLGHQDSRRRGKGELPSNTTVLIGI